MEKILKQLKWDGPDFSVVIQKNDKDGKYVFTDVHQTYILKLEDMNKNEEGSENEKKVLGLLLNHPLANLPVPLKFITTPNNVNVSLMFNSGISLDGKSFKDKFNKLPTSKQFLSCTRTILTGVHNLHSMGYVHRDITQGNVVYNQQNEQWTLIDFDFAVPFDYDAMGSEVIINKKYEWIVHPWFKLDKDDNMFFDVPRLKRYMKKTDINWYMLIDYYATAKVILYTFDLILSYDSTVLSVIKDDNAILGLLKGNIESVSPIVKKVLKLLYSIIGSFEEGSDLPNAVDSWHDLQALAFNNPQINKRARNDTQNITGTVGKVTKRNKATGVMTYALI